MSQLSITAVEIGLGSRCEVDRPGGGYRGLPVSVGALKVVKAST